MEQRQPSLLRCVVDDLRLHPVPRMAGALAFFGLFALPALALVVLVLGGALYGDAETRDGLLAQVEDNLGQEARDTLATVIENAPRPGEHTAVHQVLAVAALLLGATACFHQLQAMLNALWGAPQRKGLMGWITKTAKRLLSFVTAFAVGVAVLVYLGASTAIAAFPDELSSLLDADARAFVTGGLELLLSFGALALSSLLVYKVLPDARVPWRSAAIGALLAAALLLGGKHLVEFYLRHAKLASAYGAAGSLVVTLIWFYVAAFVVMLGAVLSHAHARWRAEPDS